MSRMPLKWIGLITAAFTFPAYGTTITFQQGISPTSTYQSVTQDIRGNASTNNGTQTLVGYQSGGVLQIRTIMGYDLSAIPAGSTINSVSLLMSTDPTQASQGTITGVGTINNYLVTPNGNPANVVVEGQVTKTNWDSTHAWTTPLGDISTLLSSATVTDANSNGTVDLNETDTATFASSSAFVTAAQDALNNNYPLQMLLIAPQAESTTGASNFIRFASDDYTANPTSLRPLLTVNYTTPEPSSAVLAAIGGAYVLARRRRKQH